jgi:hypothetical protein
VIAALVVVASLTIVVAYTNQTGQEKITLPSTSSSSNSIASIPSTTNASIQSENYSAVFLTSEGSDYALNCSGPGLGFLTEGFYSKLGFPVDPVNDYGFGNGTTPAYPYWTAGYYHLGNLQYPIVSACQAVGLAASALGLSPSDYRLGEISMNSVWIMNGTALYGQQPSWTVLFWRMYQGYFVDGDLYSGSITEYLHEIGFSAKAVVNAVTGDVYGLSSDLRTNPIAGQNFTQSVNETQALQILRQSNAGSAPGLAASGQLVSSDLGIAIVTKTSQEEIYPFVSDSTASESRLLWIFQLKSPDYAGVFGIDAQTRQVVVADVSSTLPCGGAPNCGTTTTYLSAVYGTIDYNAAKGVLVASESFYVNGSVVGEPGTYPVVVPNVIVAAPGSSGSVQVDYQAVGPPCHESGGCSSSSYDVSPSVSLLPPGVSVSFSKQEVAVTGNETAQDTMSITVAANATQGTYFVKLGPSMYGSDTWPYFVLTIWNGQGQWPVLPMLQGQDQSVILSGASG